MTFFSWLFKKREKPDYDVPADRVYPMRRQRQRGFELKFEPIAKVIRLNRRDYVLCINLAFTHVSPGPYKMFFKHGQVFA